MKIEFNIEQLSIIDRAIQQLPYYIANPLIQHINSELAKDESNKDNKKE